MKREELKSIFDALRNDPQHHLGLGDIRLTIAQQDEILAMFSPLPPAEGAEEILDKYPHSTEYPSFIHENSAIAAMTEFATRHAQKIAEDKK